MSEYVCVICGREGHTANDYDRPDWCRQIEGLKDELAGRYSVEFFGGTAHPRTDAGTIRGYGSDFDPTTEGTRIVGEFVFHDGHWWYAGRRAAAHPSGAGGGLREALDDLFAAYDKAVYENSEPWKAEWRRRILIAAREALTATPTVSRDGTE